jgi:ssRNA-specific RNase YbeY (16S rRNA maturation enzyme)
MVYLFVFSKCFLEMDMDCNTYPAGPLIPLGELYICPEVIEKYCSHQNFHIPYQRRMICLIAHGLAHIMGLDHHTKMEAKQVDSVRYVFSISKPLIIWTLLDESFGVFVNESLFFT